MGFLANLLVGKSQPRFSSVVENDWYDILIAVGASHKEAHRSVSEEREIARQEAEMSGPFGMPENYWAPQDENPVGVYGAAWPPGTFAAPPGYGEMLLAKQRTDPHTHAYLTKVRSEGVHDADISWFWNMDSVDRIMTMHLFTLNVTAFWLSVVRQNRSSPQAGLMVRKLHPCFGNPDDQPGPPNSPIPVELKHRINIYSCKRRLDNPSAFNRDIDTSSSFNEIIRREIKAGNL